jgi:hypothetical protein
MRVYSSRSKMLVEKEFGIPITNVLRDYIHATDSPTEAFAEVTPKEDLQNRKLTSLIKESK